MSEINWWLETYRLFPAAVIGIIVAIIAFLQWKTAHTKVMVDLFDKRLAVYENVLEAVTVSNTDDGSGDQTKAATIKLYRACSDAAFLFGDDISALIQEIIKTMNSERLNERRLARHNLSEEDRHRYAEEAEQAGNKKDRLGRQFQKACIPYLRIDHKGRKPKKLKIPIWLLLITFVCLLLLL